jgi:hypothetical protein
MLCKDSSMMKSVYIAAILIVAVVAVAGSYYYLSISAGPEQACVNSGGTVSTSICCLSSGDFPNSCTIGACGCSLENSHEVRVCDCGEGRCWDGNACVQM